MAGSVLVTGANSGIGLETVIHLRAAEAVLAVLSSLSALVGERFVDERGG